jgi:hypothetical protein
MLKEANHDASCQQTYADYPGQHCCFHCWFRFRLFSSSAKLCAIPIQLCLWLVRNRRCNASCFIRFVLLFKNLRVNQSYSPKSICRGRNAFFRWSFLLVNCHLVYPTNHRCALRWRAKWELPSNFESEVFAKDLSTLALQLVRFKVKRVLYGWRTYDIHRIWALLRSCASAQWSAFVSHPRSVRSRHIKT